MILPLLYNKISPKWESYNHSKDILSNQIIYIEYKTVLQIVSAAKSDETSLVKENWIAAGHTKQ